MSDGGQRPAGDPAPAPIDDGWEPEPARPGISSRFGDGPVAYFRAVPARGPAWLGTLVFVGGWAVAVYVAWLSDDTAGISNYPTTVKLQNMTSMGMQATIAAGILWGVAAFLWVRVLPAFAEGESEA